MRDDEGERPDPDSILRGLAAEHPSSKGELKIFFGYAAGVGKTYSMLRSAHDELQRGIDVVVGYVEPHARPETRALLEGLEAIPVRTFEHAGVSLIEPDIDAIIARAPQLVLVDELAHTCAEGSRHTKRYQDVEELLTAGIDVYTTINVQHLESLNDRVSAITGIVVGERIPDHIFDDADQVEFVDIEPEDLMTRLREGKVYSSDRAERALGNFFDEKNLTALREIALRRCADRANLVVERVRSTQGGSYYTGEHVLVCLSSSPSNGRILRTASRMAKAFDAHLTALSVEVPGRELAPEDDQRLTENMRLAERLGAQVETVAGDDVARQVCDYARMAGVSKLVLGHSTVRRRFLGPVPLTDRIVALAPDLDIFIIPDESVAKAAWRGHSSKSSLSPADIGKGVLILVAVTTVGYLLESVGLSIMNIAILYVFGVVATAMIVDGRTPCLIYSVLAVVLFNYFFTEPRYTLVAWDAQYPATFVVMFLTAALASSMAQRLKSQAKASAEAAYRTQVLLECDQLLQRAKNPDQVIEVMVGQLIRLLKRDVVYYPAEGGRLGPVRTFPASGGTIDPSCTSDNERGVAIWVFRNNKRAGATTDTLGSAACLYLAVRAVDTVYGVVGIVMGHEAIDASGSGITLSILGETALALEKEYALAQREEAAVLAKNEQLRANLLRSVSHDLRTPLTAITGCSSLLAEDDGSMSVEHRRELAVAINDDSIWLGGLVENLLSLTRIEEAHVSLSLEPELVEDAVDDAVRHVSRDISTHHVELSRPDEPVVAMMDVRLIVQVVVNLVNNAVQHTPKGSTIHISSSSQDGKAVIEVADDGPGIADAEKARVFERFYTIADGEGDHRRGTGLGLALCKSIVSAHGGDIVVLDNHPHGAIFRVTLPLARTDAPEDSAHLDSGSEGGIDDAD